LSRWVARQRRQRKRGTLGEDYIYRLDRIGFTWDARELARKRRAAWQAAAWDRMCALLASYRRRHGHCNVPRFWNEDRKLATWVAFQRIARKRGKLSHDRIRRLDALGFPWSGRRPHEEARWERKYEALASFKRAYGHCNVPKDWPGDPQLALWVSNQRRERKLGMLETDRIARLTSLGFEWRPRTDTWEKWFRRLEAYKKAHGDCNVPDRWAESPGLGTWVRTQRWLKKQGKLEEARRRRLDSLGFEWIGLGLGQDVRGAHGVQEGPWPLRRLGIRPREFTAGALGLHAAQI
jgi:hypothetical protein